MVSPEENPEAEPLVQPRLIRTLKNRDKLIDFGVREEVLEQAEDIIKRRRHPDTVAERVTQRISQTAKDASEPVVRDRLKNRVNQANESVLKKL